MTHPQSEQLSEATIINQTKHWIKDVVIDCKFCPFAAKPYHDSTIHYQIMEYSDAKTYKRNLQFEFARLDSTKSIATTFLIFPHDFEFFSTFLKTVNESNKILRAMPCKEDYQIASFHPAYLFQDEATNSATHFTNRSPYPMLHILREDMVTEAIINYPHSLDKIPNDNKEYTNAKGIAHMSMLLLNTMKKG
jgi:uncharacterized protein